MKFYNVKNAPVELYEKVFRQSLSQGIAGTVIGFSMTVVALAFARHLRSWFPLVIVAAFGLFILLLSASIWRKSLQPTNWLVRCGPAGMLIKFRSFLNAHFPAGDLVVFDLQPGEIAWVQKSSEKSTLETMDRDRRMDRSQFLDIKTKSVDLTELQEMVTQERRRAPVGDRGAHVHSKAHDYPVSIRDGGIIRITWRNSSSRITPSLDKAISYLAETLRVEIRTEQGQSTDFTIDPGDKVARDTMILELASRGNVIPAVQLASKFYGYSTTDARNYVDELSSKL